MSDSAGEAAPKSLADISHLFFSKKDDERADDVRGVDERADDVRGAGERADDLRGAGERAEAPRGLGGGRRTRLFVVTGGSGSPGKSTVAVSLAHAFQSTGDVAVLDADTHVPNARFYMGAPSSHYLTPLTGDEPSAGVRVSSGLVSLGCAGGRRADEIIARGREIYLDVQGESRRAMSSVVIDVPCDRLEWIAPIADRVGLFVVVARPGWEGFQEVHGVLKRLAKTLDVRSAGLIVNHVPNTDYAAKFFAKTRAAAERLLNMEMHFLGGMIRDEALGSRQRERGAAVHDRPDTVFALMLREAASKALGSEEADHTARAQSHNTT